VKAVDLIVDAHAVVGEGPIWDSVSNLLYWVDIMGNKLHVYDPASATDAEHDVGQPVGTVVQRVAGGLMLAMHHGFAAYDLDSRSLEMIADPEADKPGNRFNEGKCDPAGRFWAGTMAIDPVPDAGGLYCLDTDLSVRQVFRDVTISNGICWSLDHRTMYYIDSPRSDVRTYDFDLNTGEVRNEKVLFEIPKEVGMPDGMVVDADGMLWIAHYGGSKVCRWDPGAGEILAQIDLPVSKVTACAFGGEELDTLYITSASSGMSAVERASEPHAGGLFVTRPGFQGVEPFRFAG
jgi:sugar lactone lactonase YvrE